MHSTRFLARLSLFVVTLAVPGVRAEESGPMSCLEGCGAAAEQTFQSCRAGGGSKDEIRPAA
jgi:hypothetical protein